MVGELHIECTCPVNHSITHICLAIKTRGLEMWVIEWFVGQLRIRSLRPAEIFVQTTYAFALASSTHNRKLLHKSHLHKKLPVIAAARSLLNKTFYFFFVLTAFLLAALVLRLGVTGSSMSMPKTSERSAPASRRRFPLPDVADCKSSSALISSS